MTELKKVIVKRSEWLRGEGDGNSDLLRDDGKKCCLGFMCLVEGYSEAQILGLDYPNDVDEKRYPYELQERWMRAAARINDDDFISDSQREQQIHRLGAENGYEFVFID